MRQELDQQLCEKYPLIFADRYKDMTETAMCWGFDHGDGWYQIIDSLCGQIQHHIDWSHKNHKWSLEWNQEHPDDQRPVREPVPQVVADQIKEKFGTLRFYYHGGDDMIDGMVRMAESWSANACEECGNHGRTRYGGWHRTLCDHHAQEHGYDIGETEVNEGLEE